MADIKAALDTLEPYIRRRMDLSRTPGLAIALFDRDGAFYSVAWGMADLERQIPLTTEYLFPIGSITKQFVAFAIVQAAERGLLAFHDPVTKYLEWFVVQSDYEPITIHHLLTHSAGLIGIVDQTPAMDSAVWALRDTEIAWKPGSDFYYSDAGYQTLALILETVYNQPFEAVIQRSIFDPLHMINSSPVLTHSLRPRMAQGYRYLFDDRPGHYSQPLIPAAWIESNAGDSCIASTVEDMAKYGRMLLNSGQGPEEALISPETYLQLTRRHNPFDWFGGGAYGYGIMHLERDGMDTLWHGGGMPGHQADLLLDPQNGLGVVVLRSRPTFGDTAFKALSLLRATHLGQPLDTVDLTIPDPWHIENAADYAGDYHAAGKILTFAAENNQLTLHHDGQNIRLESHGGDRFYAHHPDFELFLLHFGREKADEDSSKVVEVFHGSSWYTNGHYNGPTAFDYPPEWEMYPGHYRSHIPWETNFRIVVRKGQLQLIRASGDEEKLLPLADGHFAIDELNSPERLEFDQIVRGKALRARLSSGDYYRFFTE